TPVEQELDLLVGRAVLLQVLAALPLLSPVEGLLRLEVQLTDVLQSQPEVDDLDRVAERVPSCGAPQGPEDRETRFVEVVQDKERDDVVAAHLIDKSAGRGHRQALRRHQGNV